MTQNQNGQDQINPIKAMTMYTWRLNKTQEQKRTETIHRLLMRSQFAH